MLRMPKKNPHAGHRLRLKSRFLTQGLDGFEQHNILELLLFFGIPRIDTNEIAHTLIERFGSLSEVLDAPYEELCKVEGITEHTATLLKLVPQLSRVYLTGQHRSEESLDSSRKLGEYFVNRFVGHTKECVYLLCLNAALQPLSCDRLSEGSVTSSGFEIKQVVEQALRNQAPRVVLAHNHPYGISVPSNEDILVTKELKMALRILNIELVDHIVVAGEDYYSISEHYPNL